MTKKKDEVNADAPATEDLQKVEQSDQLQEAEDSEKEEAEEEAEALEEAGLGQAASEDQIEQALEEAEEPPTLNPEAKEVLEKEYPVLRNHGTHNAAVTGLQTSPGYDPSKL